MSESDKRYWSSTDGLRPFRRSDRVAERCSEHRSYKPVLENASRQDGSLFFTRLPAEVRCEIYRFVMPRQTVHMERGFQTGNRAEPLSASPCVNSSGEVCSNTSSSGCNGPRGQLGVMGLHLACRSTYAEALPILYQQSSLCFKYIFQLKRFCDSALKHQQFTHGVFQSLRSLHVDFRISNRRTFTTFDEATLVASLKLLAHEAHKLENLYINVPPRPTRSLDKLHSLQIDTFMALGQLRGLKVFEFGSQHPLNYLSNMSVQGAESRRKYEEQVSAIERVLKEFILLPRNRAPSSRTDRALVAEYLQIMQLEKARP